jgi:hypothetical protein
MTINDLQITIRNMYHRLSEASWSISRGRTRSLVIQFQPVVGGLLPGVESQFAADQLRKSRLCTRVLRFDEGTLRVDGIPARKMDDFLQRAADLGARRWGAIA